VQSSTVKYTLRLENQIYFHPVISFRSTFLVLISFITCIKQTTNAV